MQRWMPSAPGWRASRADHEGLPGPAGLLVGLPRPRARGRRALLLGAKAAVDQRIISDVTLIPMYEEVRNHKAGRRLHPRGQHAKKPPDGGPRADPQALRDLTPEAVAKGCPYRKENPLHRLYYHEIAPPEKIRTRCASSRSGWSRPTSATCTRSSQASRLQFRLLAAYPWTKNTGKVARLLANYILISTGYLPAIVHSIERQRYYEALRHENDGLTPDHGIAAKQHRDHREVLRRAAGRELQAGAS